MNPFPLSFTLLDHVYLNKYQNKYDDYDENYHIIKMKFKSTFGRTGVFGR